MMKRWWKVSQNKVSSQQVVSTWYDSLEIIITFYHNAPLEKTNGCIPLMYNKLRSFKFIYF
jgi:hypothetical protein